MSLAEKMFDKEVECPICNSKLVVKVVKSSKVRVESRDTDFMVYYKEPNPSYYDVWVCKECGYAGSSSRFNGISESQKEKVRENISKKWNRNKTYPEYYAVEDAIEMHKLALLNSIVKEEKDSDTAHISLKTAWLYRIKKDAANEKRFLKQALAGFIKAYEYEDLPVAGLDKPSLTYLIGELYRRTGDKGNALKWFSLVLADRNAKAGIKDMARDQKDLVKT